MEKEFENVYEAPEVVMLLASVECGFEGSEPSDVDPGRLIEP